jgi:hypothetical protein
MDNDNSLLSRLTDRWAASWLYHRVGDTDWLSSKSEFIRDCQGANDGLKLRQVAE